jgi:hypothetical protein
MEALFFWWQWMFIVLGLALVCVLVESLLVYLILKVKKRTRAFSWQLLNKAAGNPVIQTQIFPYDQTSVSAPGAINATSNKTENTPNKRGETIVQYIVSRDSPAPKAEPRHVVPPQKTASHRVPSPPEIGQAIFASVPPQSKPARRPPRPLMESSRVVSPHKAQPIQAVHLPGEEAIKAQNFELMKEVGDNLVIAATAMKGNLVSFRTEIMDANSSRLNSLTSQIRVDLSEAYTDIRLANTLVWLSKVMGRQSKEMESSYLELCIKIAEHLGSARLGMINSGI